MNLQPVPKWLCNCGTGRTHRLRCTRRQKLENVYRPVSHYLCGAREGPFSHGSPHIDKWTQTNEFRLPAKTYLPIHHSITFTVSTLVQDTIITWLQRWLPWLPCLSMLPWLPFNQVTSPHSNYSHVPVLSPLVWWRWGSPVLTVSCLLAAVRNRWHRQLDK